jgi:hypothetical protein
MQGCSCMNAATSMIEPLERAWNGIVVSKLLQMFALPLCGAICYPDAEKFKILQ